MRKQKHLNNTYCTGYIKTEKAQCLLGVQSSVIPTGAQHDLAVACTTKQHD